MSYWWKNEDPDAQTEEGKYSHPVPGRVFILSYLKKQKKPLSYKQLCARFKLDNPEQQEGLRRRLIAMCKEGQLIQNRQHTFCLSDEAKNIPGTVCRNNNGSGLLITDDEDENFFLTPKQMEYLFDGDKILVREMGVDSKNNYLCQVIKVIKRDIKEITGIYHKEYGQPFVSPYNLRLGTKINIIQGKLHPKIGQYVVVKIHTYSDPDQQITGVITEIIGSADKTKTEVNIAVRSYNIPYQWPKKVTASVKKISEIVAEEDKKHRIDLRHLPFVTIDDESAKDFDDAVYAEIKKRGGWKLFVAIADVSHYVMPGGALDEEAQNRGNSVYFPNQVIPMLPEKLSNGLCSLKPKEDRLAIVCEMQISAKGKLTRYAFYEGVIRSQARLTYDQVAAIQGQNNNKKTGQWRRQFSALLPHLNTLYDLYKTLKMVREKRGAIEFDTVETRVLFDKYDKIKTIIPVVRNDAHRLIEECMLCANQAAAKFLDKHKLTSLFRIHEGPTEQKLKTLYTFLQELDLHFFGKDKPTPDDYQKLLSHIQKRSDASVVQTMLLRSLGQAEYHPDNTGHFGLAYKAYTHFTSPIRRYPDLLVHRAIRHIIRSEIPSNQVRRIPDARHLQKKEIYPYDENMMLALASQCSMTERRADDATRDVMTSLKCQYIQQHLGEVYTGTVVSVTNFGLFVELDDFYITGLVHITCLPKDYYHFDHARQRLVGERSRHVFSLGNVLRVKVVKVNITEKNIDFQLEETAALKKRRKSPKKKRR